ncbi:MAG: bifunctional nuclease domain-containing protein [Nitrospinota bacterium]
MLNGWSRETGPPPKGRRLGFILLAVILCATSVFLPAASGQAGPQEEQMKVRGLVVDPRSRSPVLLLEDLETGQKVLPVWIGMPEANAILMALNQVVIPRPMTHDLLRNLLRDLKATVLRVAITGLRENTFLATIYLRAGKKVLQVDSRPSDAVALALRTDAPIFASVQVLARAGQSLPVEGSLTSEVRPYGLVVQEITRDLLPHFQGAEPGSILITDVKEGSQGARDGLKRGDVVLHVNDLQVRGLKNFLQLLQTATSQNEKVRLFVHRGDKRLQLDLSGKKPGN